jgi:hypothetical protein
MNAVGELAGGAHADIQGCLPDNWKTDAQASEPTDDSANQQVAQSSGTLKKIVDTVETVIKQVCQFKDTIKGFLVKRYVKRSVLRQLLEKRGRKWGFLKKIGSSISSGAKKAAAAAKAAAKKAAEIAAKAAKAAAAVIKKVVDVIKKVWAQFVKVVKAFFASPLMASIKSVFTCVQGMQTAGEQLVATVKGIIAKFQKIMTGTAVGIIDVLIDLICNWDDFKAAIAFLTQAQGEKDVVNKWGLIGKFVGKLLFAIGKTRRFRRFNLRLRLYRN